MLSCRRGAHTHTGTVTESRIRNRSRRVSCIIIILVIRLYMYVYTHAYGRTIPYSERVLGLGGCDTQRLSSAVRNSVYSPSSLPTEHIDSTVTKNVNETEMFYYEIQPELFNWTNGVDSNIVFTPSLHNYPDLLPWIHYKFNNKNRNGYLYGTPPAGSSEKQIQLDIIGLNKKTYQVLTQVIQLNIIKRSEFAKYEIRFKINNLNVEDMFQEERIMYLLDIFRQNLWLDSKQNLYVTFLASASDLGQRLPLDPNDTEGVVVHLGSNANFSTILYDLKQEISKLQEKMSICPKDFKRTSVERYFRANGFNLDWCSFKLVDLTIFYHNNITNIKNETSSNRYSEENTWTLIESSQYSQFKYAETTSTLNIILLICMIFAFGIIISIGVKRWYGKKKDIFMKI